jgi:hypothetical protein
MTLSRQFSLAVNLLTYRLRLLELRSMVSLLAKLFSTADYQTIFENLWLNASSFTCH